MTVTPNQATYSTGPNIDCLLHAPELMSAYLQACPNGKLPPRFHDLSLLLEHRERKGGIFQGRDAVKAEVSASKWAGIIRTNMSKLREIKGDDVKYGRVARKANG